MRARYLLPLCGAAVLAAAGCDAMPASLAEEGRPPLGLMTTLPLYWPEIGEFGELVTGGQDKGWVRSLLERSFDLQPLDVLDTKSLSRFDRLILAQPRALSPQENVALNEWVRAGGELLLFADPMLTAHTRYAIGDRRRPQDVVLLSPILAHWGLELMFEAEQPAGARAVTGDGLELPVDLPGRWSASAGAPCELSLQDIVAICALGRGRAVIVADAAVLEDGEGGADTAQRDALTKLLARAFD